VQVEPDNTWPDGQEYAITANVVFDVPQDKSAPEPDGVTELIHVMLAPLPDDVVPEGHEYPLIVAALVLELVVVHCMFAPEPDGVAPAGQE
jgi:hypothetical protein